MSRIVKISIWALVAIAIIACISLVVVWFINRDGAEAPADPLAGTQWQVQSYYKPAEADGMASPLGDTQLTAEFTDGAPSGDGVVNGSSGCNTYSADYEVDGNNLSVGPANTSGLACDYEVMAQEDEYLTALTGARRYRVGDNTLEIRGSQTLSYTER